MAHESIPRWRKHECNVRDVLIERGYVAAFFGQAQVPEEQRKFLQQQNTLLRNMPDILVVHPVKCFVEVKSSERLDTPNHSIQADSLKGAELCGEAFHAPVYFVFDDLRVADATLVRQHAVPGK